MRAFVPIVVSLLCLGLGGCAIPDLVAHTVKEIEKSQRDGGSRTASPTPESPSSPSRTEEEPPPPARAPQPARSSVTVEELPAR